jgi:thiol-disulfide isomerase/thioredoxin
MLFKRLLSYLLTFSLVVFFAWYAYIKFSAVDEGDEAANFTAELYNGSEFDLSKLKGNYVLLDFWASWCGSCRRTNKDLSAFYKMHRGDLTIVSVAFDSDKKVWQKAIESDGLNWKNHIMTGTKYPLMSEIAQKYGVTSIPTLILISPEGVVLGEKNFEELESILAE